MTEEIKVRKVKLFKIVNDVDAEFFVGYTEKKLDMYFESFRLGHFKKTKAFTHMEGVGWDHVKIELIEKALYNKEALRARIRELKPTLNQFPGEYNKTEFRKKYYEKHKEQIKAQITARYHKNKGNGKMKEYYKKQASHCDLCNKDVKFIKQHLESELHIRNLNSTICTFCDVKVHNDDMPKHRVSDEHLQKGNEAVNKYVDELKLNKELGYVFDDCHCPDGCKMHEREEPEVDELADIQLPADPKDIPGRHEAVDELQEEINLWMNQKKTYKARYARVKMIR
jgi:hypothetical protein